MVKDTSKQIERIHRFGITCVINDNGLKRHFQNGYEYVDLGLPSGTRWATMNLGANTITDIGSKYFATEDNEPTTSCHIHYKIPSHMQFKELLNNTITLETEINGNKGRKCINKTDDSKWIFLPYDAVYWLSVSATREYTVGEMYIISIKFSENYITNTAMVKYHHGLQIRGVLD